MVPWSADDVSSSHLYVERGGESELPFDPKSTKFKRHLETRTRPSGVVSNGCPSYPRICYQKTHSSTGDHPSPFSWFSPRLQLVHFVLRVSLPPHTCRFTDMITAISWTQCVCVRCCDGGVLYRIVQLWREIPRWAFVLYSVVFRIPTRDL